MSGVYNRIVIVVNMTGVSLGLSEGSPDKISEIVNFVFHAFLISLTAVAAERHRPYGDKDEVKHTRPTVVDGSW